MNSAFDMTLLLAKRTMPACLRMHAAASTGQITGQKGSTCPLAPTKHSNSHVHHAGLAAPVPRDLLRHDALPAVCVCLGHLLLEVHDGLRGVQALGAAIGAI